MESYNASISSYIGFIIISLVINDLTYEAKDKFFFLRPRTQKFFKASINNCVVVDRPFIKTVLVVVK